MKIKKDNMALFTSGYNEDYEYEFVYPSKNLDDTDFIDGYEIEIFTMVDNEINLTIKKYLDVNFIGNREVGEIGLLIEKSTDNGVRYDLVYSSDVYREYYQKILKYYKHKKFYYSIRGDFDQIKIDKVDDMLKTLIRTNRDNKIEILL